MVFYFRLPASSRAYLVHCSHKKRVAHLEMHTTARYVPLRVFFYHLETHTTTRLCVPSAVVGAPLQHCSIDKMKDASSSFSKSWLLLTMLFWLPVIGWCWLKHDSLSLALAFHTRQGWSLECHMTFRPSLETNLSSCRTIIVTFYYIKVATLHYNSYTSSDIQKTSSSSAT